MAKNGEDLSRLNEVHGQEFWDRKVQGTLREYRKIDLFVWTKLLRSWLMRDMVQKIDWHHTIDALNVSLRRFIFFEMESIRDREKRRVLEKFVLQWWARRDKWGVIRAGSQVRRNLCDPDKRRKGQHKYERKPSPLLKCVSANSSCTCYLHTVFYAPIPPSG